MWSKDFLKPIGTASRHMPHHTAHVRRKSPNSGRGDHRLRPRIKNLGHLGGKHGPAFYTHPDLERRRDPVEELSRLMG